MTADQMLALADEIRAHRLAVDEFLVRWDGGARADTDYVASLMRGAVNTRATDQETSNAE